jgi:hypothetical protein
VCVCVCVCVWLRPRLPTWARKQRNTLAAAASAWWALSAVLCLISVCCCALRLAVSFGGACARACDSHSVILTLLPRSGCQAVVLPACVLVARVLPLTASLARVAACSLPPECCAVLCCAVFAACYPTQRTAERQRARDRVVCARDPATLHVIPPSNPCLMQSLLWRVDAPEARGRQRGVCALLQRFCAHA